MSKYDGYYTLDKPVPYKNIQLFPVKVKDYQTFYNCVPCLTLEKNSIKDIKVIKMSYLEYMYYLHKENKEIDFLLLWDTLLKLCSHEDEIEIKYYFYKNDSKNPVFEIKGELFYRDDFDEIRNIICEQNMVTLPDESIQKEVRDIIQRDREYKERQAGNKPASFEDTILCLVAGSAMSLDAVYELSIRKFIKLLQRVDAKLHYQIYMTAAMSGMVEFKDKTPLRHWMSDLEKESKNDDVLLDYDEFKEKHHMTDNKKGGK